MGKQRRAIVTNGRNDVRLQVRIDGEMQSHFRLKEFENADGLAMVHHSVLVSLERVRRDLCEIMGEEVWVIITSGLRTEADNERLASRLGWSDEGGAVSRNSKHLAKYGGIAVDLVASVARSRERVEQKVLGENCRRHFDWVKDDYTGGHVHADNRGVLTVEEDKGDRG